ncbi:cell surface hydrolase, membrane-bound (putative) [Lactobacillus plantarum JDM1] [Lactiplantibacillus mudanjiangensis]|uniref:alpha/beta hydrolase n=1 Tax=Lactiplantibacillus mudanjiangensis TaxID=1296538 RepID=UPI001014C8CB|nr:alpha/beta hydrolase [Lactiplantibacillus mudanjiangensis]VDG20348.1 cell surface hydrolase, membrane-bound (putative) [Lactobacillus plantarum JDM1] [Lactiplantibacillus mudanjiangensis]VDG33960.1 cell surface hydrolase, membrane-bound (putative) [Lactobacillus plantarum JDM1] [Lactiplantibacillus mudanjiangensis]
MKKRGLVAALATPLALFTASLIASEKLYNFAFKRVDYVPETSADKQKYADAYWAYVKWLKQQPVQDWTLNPDDQANRLVAKYVPAKAASHRTVIISHGYKGDGETMANYAYMFHNMGYNVLLPDDRGHGKSAGKYISFGWQDRRDYLEWINQVIKQNGPQTEIVLFGVSMGGATVEMMSGEDLPAQVKAIIADCGYTSIEEELAYLLKEQFHLPKYPFVPIVSFINRHRMGYFLSDVSSVEQLRHNKLPIFFIHGEKDIYVPSWMLKKNYRAAKGPKMMWQVPNATHAESFWIDPAAYEKHVSAFLNRYLPKL